MRHLPSLKHLQYFVALAEQRSFTKAAQSCHVTQSTLSAGIAALETVLGQSLVDRSQKQIALTAYGADTLRTARQLLMQAGDILDRAQSFDAPLTGPLRLGIIPTIAPYLLPHILPPAQQQYPDMILQIDEDLSARLVESLKNGALDLVLMAFPYDMTGLAHSTLYEEPFLLAAPRGRWRGAGPVSVSQLDSRELLLLEEGHCLRDHALAACQLTTPQERRPFNATSLPTLIQMVRHGYGMTLLPALAAESAALAEELDILRFAAPVPVRQIGLAWRKDSPRASEFTLLAGLIKDAAAARLACFSGSVS